ncbi:MAG: rhomboid family intramembrane serine protease [Ketobacter sp.]|nr:MAG: rhomboid family intramembrane serine protease [Ketobacter sp.]
MLIIPAERGIDWRRAPVVTAAMIALCCIVFFGWQWSDSARMQRAAEYYYENQLLQLELPIFLSHLSQTRRKDLSTELESIDPQEDAVTLIYTILSDPSFTHVLQKTDEEFWGDDVFADWRRKRRQVNELLDQISSFKLGLIPQVSRPITFLTYQFMHGDSMHLIGNMVILALTGIAVEAAIGSFNFLLCYLLCGIVAGLSYTLFNWSSYLPLVGASGSISGVMGMYAAIYGMRKIRFFYSLIFYFGYFTAPGLVILPIWVAWELYNAFLGSTSGVAYVAHAGGLLMGGLGMLAARRYLVQVEENYLDQAPDEDLEYRTELDDFLKQLAAFNFDSAKRKLTTLETKYPSKATIVEQRYFLEKLAPESKSFHQFAHELLATPTRDEVFMYMLRDVYRDYTLLNKAHPLEESTLLKLMLSFCQIEAWDTVQEMVKQAQTRRIQDPMMVKILRLLSRNVEQNGDSHLSNQLNEMAGQLENSLKTAPE